MESPNLWYTYTATKTGNVTVSLCYPDYVDLDNLSDSEDFDTKLAIYRGVNCFPSQSDLIECNDDFCGLQSEITFAATAGSQYLIEVGGFDSMTGRGMISIRSEGVPPTKALDLGDAPDSTNNSGAIMAAYPKGGSLGVRASYPTVFNDGSGTGPYPSDKGKKLLPTFWIRDVDKAPLSQALNWFGDENVKIEGLMYIGTRVIKQIWQRYRVGIKAQTITIRILERLSQRRGGYKVIHGLLQNADKIFTVDFFSVDKVKGVINGWLKSKGGGGIIRP